MNLFILLISSGIPVSSELFQPSRFFKNLGGPNKTNPVSILFSSMCKEEFHKLSKREENIGTQNGIITIICDYQFGIE